MLGRLSECEIERKYERKRREREMSELVARMKYTNRRALRFRRWWGFEKNYLLVTSRGFFRLPAEGQIKVTFICILPSLNSRGPVDSRGGLLLLVQPESWEGLRRRLGPLLNRTDSLSDDENTQADRSKFTLPVCFSFDPRSSFVDADLFFAHFLYICMSTNSPN